MAIQFPKGKYISMVKVGEKGQIVIPKGARDLFSIQPGDNLLLLADEEKGIALCIFTFFYIWHISTMFMSFYNF